MDFEWDPAKAAKNEAEHGVSFELAKELFWESALIMPDTRRDYSEDRYMAYGFIGERLYALVFTPRAHRVRVISLRKTNRRERKFYEQEKAG